MANIIGTSQRDRIDGGDEADVIEGLGENDLLFGGLGNDLLLGGGDDDGLFGDAGDDTLDGGEGNDSLYASQGRDTLRGGAGLDLLAIEQLPAESGTFLDGGDGIDELYFNGVAATADIVLSLGDPASPQLIEGVTFVNLERTNFVSGSGNDTLIGGLYEDAMSGRGGNDVVDGGGGNDSIAGGDGIDTLLGGSGDDVVIALAGDFLADGGSGTDRLDLDLDSISIAVTLSIADPSTDAAAAGATIRNFELLDYVGGNGVDDITGGALRDQLEGGAGDDILRGGGGNDLLRGDEGIDQLFGGAGDDFLASFDDSIAGDSLIDGGEGFDTFDMSLGSFGGATTIDILNSTRVVGVERIVFGGSTRAAAVDTISGGDFVDELAGGAGNDLLDGRGGDDQLRGGHGDDRLIGGDGNDNLSDDTGFDNVLEGGEGNDTLSFIQAGGTLDGGAGNDKLFGHDFTEELLGGDGNDQLFSGGGPDRMVGGRGDDIYRVQAAGCIIVEEADEGVDTVSTELASFSLVGMHIENLTGFFNDQRLVGNDGANTISGGGGNDVLIGGAGNDVTSGGTGNDVHGVDSAGDVVVEAAGQGSDRVLASASYRLTAGAEVELLAASDQLAVNAVNLAGNEFSQTIFGNDGVNRLDGEAGNDQLWGRAGDDVLVGGVGSDVTIGGAGNDVHAVDGLGDAVIEAAGEGSDRVLASATYRLGGNAEVELLATANQAGTDSLDLAGNGFAQTIFGNAGTNRLDGLAGNDTLWGFGGNDTLSGGEGNDVARGGIGNDIYAVDTAADAVIELAGEGSDRVLASTSYALTNGTEVELLSASNQAGIGALDLSGNGFAQAILGNNGVNRLVGGGGNDTLWGLGGADEFCFFTSPAMGVARIADFTGGVDRILLDDGVFTGLAVGTLSAGAFVTGRTAQDATDRILYDTTTGALYFDADGIGGVAAVHFATLGVGLGVSASDFLVI